MKTLHLIPNHFFLKAAGAMMLVAGVMLSTPVSAQTDNSGAPQTPQAPPPPRQDGQGHGQRPGGFRPKLEGVWQLCSLRQDSAGQPQMNMLPVLRVYYGEERYQTVAIPNEGGCFVLDQANIEKTSDSTYTATPVKMRPDSVASAPVSVVYRMWGPLWLSLKFQKEGETQDNVEFWIRVLQNDARAQRQQQQMGQAPRPGQGGPGRRPGQGRRNNMRSQIQKNPFDQSQSSTSISEADD